jgi:hypothetical protein
MNLLSINFLNDIFGMSLVGLGVRFYPNRSGRFFGSYEISVPKFQEPIGSFPKQELANFGFGSFGSDSGSKC